MSYILKESALKILNSYIDEEYPDPTSGATLNMIDEIKALPSLPDNSQWIPVSDRLPEEGSEIVMFVEYSDKSYNFIVDKYYDTKTVWRHDKDVNVTHWMPLPPPPLT